MSRPLTRRHPDPSKHWPRVRPVALSDQPVVDPFELERLRTMCRELDEDRALALAQLHGHGGTTEGVDGANPVKNTEFPVIPPQRFRSLSKRIRPFGGRSSRPC
jgi:hypothetical protein